MSVCLTGLTWKKHTSNKCMSHTSTVNTERFLFTNPEGVSLQLSSCIHTYFNVCVVSCFILKCDYHVLSYPFFLSVPSILWLPVPTLKTFTYVSLWSSPVPLFLLGRLSFLLLILSISLIYLRCVGSVERWCCWCVSDPRAFVFWRLLGGVLFPQCVVCRVS